MKEHTSRFLKVIAYLFLAFPVSYLTFAAVMFNVSGVQILNRLATPSFWLLSIAGMTTGYGLKEMKRWSWNAFLGSCILIAYSNALIASRYSDSQNKLLAFCVSIGILFLLIYRLGKEIRVPYFLPKIHWWESNPRYKLAVPLRVEQVQSGFEGEILDLSMGGCFVKSRMELDQNEHILCHFTLFGEPLAIGGTVVWRSASSVTHPKGVGVKFDALDKTQKKILRAACVHLKRISAHQKLRHSMKTEEFIQKLESLKAHRLKITQKPSPAANVQVS